MTRSCLLLVAVAVMSSTVSLPSHHAIGEVYDESRTVTLRGEIVALVYRNPHSLLHLDVADRGGLRTWAVEWRAASRLRNRGVAPRTLQPGDRVVVCGNPGRDPGQFRLLLLSVTRPADGWASTPRSCAGR